MSNPIGPLIIFAVIAFLGVISSQTKAKKLDEAIDFGPSPAILILLIALSSFFLTWFVVSLIRDPSDSRWLVFLLIGVLGIFGVPANITVTPEAVREKFWWRTERTILWKDVLSINYKTASDGVQIKGMNGKKITHSKGNRGRFEFELACMKYTTHAKRELNRRQKRSKP